MKIGKLNIQQFKNNNLIVRLLVCYHLIFPIICWYYTISKPKESDSERYIRLATDHDWTKLLDFGDKFVALLISPFVKLGLGYLSLTIIFSLISLKGFLIYYNLYKDKGFFKSLNGKYILTLWLFLPSLHFWTGFLGKDAIIFVMMALVIKALDTKNFKSPLLYLFVILSFFIRPHSIIIIIVALTITVIFLTKKPLKNKLFYTVTASLTVLFFSFLLLKYFLNIDEYDGLKDIVVTFYTNIQEHQKALGSNTYNVLTTSYFEKLTILSIRPLFFDANSLLQYLASIQNTALIVVFIYYFYLFFSKKKRMNNISYKFALITALLFLLIIGTYIFNLGQASRMRVMILPYVFYALTNMYSQHKIIKN